MQNIAPQEHNAGANPSGNFGIQHFQETIKKLKAQDLEIGDRLHMDEIDPNLLTAKDQEIWDMVEGVLASNAPVDAIMSEFKEYQAHTKTKTDGSLAGYLADKLTKLATKQFLAKQRKQILE